MSVTGPKTLRVSYERRRALAPLLGVALTLVAFSIAAGLLSAIGFAMGFGYDVVWLVLLAIGAVVSIGGAALAWCGLWRWVVKARSTISDD